MGGKSSIISLRRVCFLGYFCIACCKHLTSRETVLKYVYKLYLFVLRQLCKQFTILSSFLFQFFFISINIMLFSQIKIMDMLQGQQLVNKQRQIFSAQEALDEVDIICYYFSAHWCPPCRQFTPVLADFYRVRCSS